MIKVYDDSQVKGIFENAGLPDGVYVHINLKEGNSGRVARLGLNTALRELEENREEPVILYSFESPSELFLDKRFRRAMSNPDVHFLRLPFALAQIPGYLKLPAFRSQALEIAAEGEEKTDLLKTLRHDYSHGQEEAVKAMQRARTELGLTGTDDEITAILQDASIGLELLEKNIGALPGVFCDVEGTLQKNGEINQTIVERLLVYAASYPVTLWTGGDVKRISRETGPKFERFVENYTEQKGSMTNLHLKTPILSKYAFRHSKPEIVLDDLAEEEFVRRYGIEPQQYIKV